MTQEGQHRFDTMAYTQTDPPGAAQTMAECGVYNCLVDLAITYQAEVTGCTPGRDWLMGHVENGHLTILCV